MSGMRLVTAALAALFLLASQVSARDDLFSLTWFSPPFGCTGSDFWVQLWPNLPANKPTVPIKIVGVEMHSGWTTPGYVMIGLIGPRGLGDSIGPWVLNGTRPGITWFPSGKYFPFDPATDELHLHYQCMPSDDGRAGVFVQIFYTIDDRP